MRFIMLCGRVGGVMDDDRTHEQGDPSARRPDRANGARRMDGDPAGEVRAVRRGTRTGAGNIVPTPASTRSAGGLTPAEFYDLAEVPPEVEWFANLDNPNTRRAYRNDVREFTAFAGLGRPEEFRRVNRAVVIAWRADLEARTNRRGEPLAGSSVRRKLSALSSLFDHLLESNAVLINPCGGVKRPPNEHAGEGKTPALSDRNARRLLDAPPADTLKGLRDRAILSTLLYHGLRREELCKLRVGDAHERGNYRVLRVRGKGRKTRHVELHPTTDDRIRAYLEEAGHGGDVRGPLFRPVRNQVGPTDRPLNANSVYRQVIRKWGVAVGIPAEAFTTHSCRATAATNAIDHGAALEEVQTWLGHADVGSTRLYVRKRGGGERSPTFKVSY